MLRCYAVFLRSEPNSCTTTVKRRLRCIQVIRVQTLRVRSGGLWSAFAAKGFKANGNVPLPCLIFVQKKRRLYKTKVSETSMVVQVGLFVEGSATVRTLEFWGKQRLSHIATNPNQQPYTKIIWDVRHFTMSDSMTFPPEARLAALSCFCISAACKHDKWQLMISVLEHVWPDWPKKDALSLMRKSPERKFYQALWPSALQNGPSLQLQDHQRLPGQNESPAHFTSDLVQSPSPPLPQGSPGERPKTSQIRSNDRIISKRQKRHRIISRPALCCNLCWFPETTNCAFHFGTEPFSSKQSAQQFYRSLIDS